MLQQSPVKLACGYTWEQGMGRTMGLHRGWVVHVAGYYAQAAAYNEGGGVLTPSRAVLARHAIFV